MAEQVASQREPLKKECPTCLSRFVCLLQSVEDSCAGYEKDPALKYPCGKTEMDIIHCPDCLDHFKECAAKSKGLFHENVMTYMEINYELAKHQAERKKRLQDRAKCRSLAKSILKKRQQITEMQKEMSKIFYNDDLRRAFNHMERTCDPKNEKIREALRD